jgi:hypothetical protein
MERNKERGVAFLHRFQAAYESFARVEKVRKFVRKVDARESSCKIDSRLNKIRVESFMQREFIQRAHLNIVANILQYARAN